jgi:hypothetical protein
MIKIIFVRHGESTENVASQQGIKYDHENHELYLINQYMLLCLCLVTL